MELLNEIRQGWGYDREGRWHGGNIRVAPRRREMDSGEYDWRGFRSGASMVSAIQILTRLRIEAIPVFEKDQPKLNVCVFLRSWYGV